MSANDVASPDVAPTSGLTSVDRISKLPMVEVALMKSAGIYERFKASSEWVNWTLSTAESSARKAIDTAQPVIDKLQQPIAIVDQTLCKGLDYVESTFPCVKGQPAQVSDSHKPKQLYEDAKVYSLDKVALAKEKAHNIADLSWQKANDVLATRYGNIAFNGINASAQIAEQYLDYYFPPTEEEVGQEESRTDEVVPASDGLVDDRVMQTVHTVGHLSTKLGRRAYQTIRRQARSLTADNAHEYVRSLVALITLNNYVKALQQGEAEKKDDEKEGGVKK